MDAPIKKIKMEVTEDDQLGSENVWNPSESEAVGLQSQQFPKACSSPGYSNKNMAGSKQIQKDVNRNFHLQNKPLLKCTYCAFKSYYLAGYKQHIKTHGKSGEFANKECKVTEDDKIDSENVTEQLQVKQPLKTYSSKNMAKSFESRHIQKDFSKNYYWQNKPMFNCAHCSFRSYFKAGYKRHIKIHDKVASEEFQVEATEDDEIESENVWNPSMSEAEDPQEQQSPKTSYSLGNSSEDMARSVESNQIQKNFSKHSHWKNKLLLKCDHCSFRSFFLAGYKRHIKIHDKGGKAASNGSLFCDYCKEYFNDVATYRAHTCKRAVESVYGSFKCRLCKYRSKRRSTFTNHMAAVHDRNSKGELLPMDAFWCQDCDFTCTDEPTLDKHVEERHPDRSAGMIRPRYSCPTCHFNTVYKFVLERHKRIHKPRRKYKKREDTTSQKPMDRHTCEICGYYNGVAIKVDRHRAIHGKVKAYKCPYCASRFTYKYTMGVHVENYHKKCRTAAYSMVMANRHTVQDKLDQTKEVTNSGSVATVCTLQPTSGNLLPETKLEDSITYGCSLCKFTFSVRAEAKVHCEIAHADKLPMTYKCGSCHIGTLYFNDMVRHLQQHLVHTPNGSKAEADSDIKQHQPFVCVHCDLIFDSRKELKRHKRSKHGLARTLFKCSKCDYTSLDRSKVARHLKEPHDFIEQSAP